MSAFSRQTAAEFVRRYWPDDTATPKHEKLCRAITSSISEGFWGAGARLPTETEFAAVTPCSLGTVQRALRRLVEEGVIERRRGSGTIVADHRRGIEQPWHMRFYDDAGATEKLLPVYTRVLERKIIADEGPWSAAIEQNGREVVKIDRIFSIDNRFDIYAVFYAIAARFPELKSLLPQQLEDVNFKLMLAKQHVLPVHRVKQSMRFEKPNLAMAEASGLKPGQPAAVVNVIAFALNGEAIYYQDFYIPPNRYRLDLGITTSASG